MDQVTVVVNGKHRLVVDVTSGKQVDVVSRSLDLTHNNLFRHPFEPRRDAAFFHAVTPLCERAEQAFRALYLADDSNVLVQALGRYRKERLAAAINELKQPLNFNESAVCERMYQLRGEPQKAEELLHSIVRRIDLSNRSFFDMEKMLGTFDCLSQDGWHKCPASFAEEGQVCEPPRFQFASAPNKECLFDVENQTVFVPKGATPTPAAIVEALCLGGTPGEGVRYLNRAAAMQMMTDRIALDIEQAKARVFDYERSHVDSSSGVSATRSHILLGSSFALAGLSVFVPSFTAAYQIPQTLCGAIAIVLGCAGLSCLPDSRMRAFLGASSNFRENTYSASAEARASDFLRRGWIEYQSVLSNVLLHFVDSRSSASQHTLLGSELASTWRSEFEGLPCRDPRTLPTEVRVSRYGGVEMRCVEAEPVISFEGSMNGDVLGPRSRADIRRGLYSELVSLEHVDSADRHWNLLSSIAVVASFATWANIQQPVDTSFFEILLSDAQRLRCNKSGYFDPIKGAFDAMRQRYQLSSEDWAFCAQPLYVFDLLERSLAQRQAQRIAVDLLLGDVAR